MVLSASNHNRHDRYHKITIHSVRCLHQINCENQDLTIQTLLSLMVTSSWR
jgi:hypothetical protein